MGCNNSRKNLQEKSSLNSKELEKCNAKFLKLSRVLPGYHIYYIQIAKKVKPSLSRVSEQLSPKISCFLINFTSSSKVKVKPIQLIKKL